MEILRWKIRIAVMWVFYAVSMSASMVLWLLGPGVIEEVILEIVGYNQVKVEIHARDYVKWLDRKLVSGVYTDANADDMIKHILDDSASDFGQTDIEAVAPILPKIFNFVPVSEALQEIADTVNAVWYIDQDRSVHFTKKDKVGNRAPLSWYDVDTEANAGNLRFSVSTESLQNSLIVKDFYVRSPDMKYMPPNATKDGFGADLSPTANEVSMKRILLTDVPYDLDSFTFSVKPSGGAYTDKLVLWDDASSIASTDVNAAYVNFKGE